jgi:hypothetical protein
MTSRAYKGPPPDQQYYLKRIVEDQARRRRRDTQQLFTDPGNWWFDIDSGLPNEVTDALVRDNPYVGALAARAQLMDQSGAPLSISRGQRARYRPPYGNPTYSTPPFSTPPYNFPPYVPTPRPYPPGYY